MSKTTEKFNFGAAFKFDDGTMVKLSLEDLAFQALSHYARMYTSESVDLRLQGEVKLREMANILAKADGASMFGKLLKEKQKEKFEGKNEEIKRFLDDHRGLANTKKLAALVQERFGINSFRSCEDAVREWKKHLRSAGGE